MPLTHGDVYSSTSFSESSGARDCVSPTILGIGRHAFGLYVDSCRPRARRAKSCRVSSARLRGVLPVRMSRVPGALLRISCVALWCACVGGSPDPTPGSGEPSRHGRGRADRLARRGGRRERRPGRGHRGLLRGLRAHALEHAHRQRPGRGVRVARGEETHQARRRRRVSRRPRRICARRSRSPPRTRRSSAASRPCCSSARPWRVTTTPPTPCAPMRSRSRPTWRRRRRWCGCRSSAGSTSPTT